MMKILSFRLTLNSKVSSTEFVSNSQFRSITYGVAIPTSRRYSRLIDELNKIYILCVSFGGPINIVPLEEAESRVGLGESPDQTTPHTHTRGTAHLAG